MIYPTDPDVLQKRKQAFPASHASRRLFGSETSTILKF